MLHSMQAEKSPGSIKYLLSTILQTLQLTSLGLLNVGLILGLVLLSGCSNVPRALKVMTAQGEVPRPPQKPVLPSPLPVETLPVKWVIKQMDGKPLFCIDPKQYPNLSHNQAETLRWVTEAKWRLDYYAEPIQ